MSDVEAPVSNTHIQKLGAEALGTFILVFAGAGTIAVSGAPVPTSLAFGFAVIAMMYAVGWVSGGHFNPAVSVGHAVAGRMSWREAGLYSAAQVIAAFVAGLSLFIVLHGIEDFEAEGNMGQNFFGEQSGLDYAVWAALLVELVAAFFFVTVFLAMTDTRHPNRAVAPLVVGLTLATLYFATVGLTGGGFNPARSIGVGLFAGGDAVLQLWLFILAPLLGAVGAGIAYPAVFGRDAEPVEGSGLNFSRPAKAEAAPVEETQQWATEYPGWKWDGAAQQWVPDPTTAPAEWAEQAATEPVHEAEPADETATTQFQQQPRDQ